MVGPTRWTCVIMVITLVVVMLISTTTYAQPNSTTSTANFTTGSHTVYYSNTTSKSSTSTSTESNTGKASPIEQDLAYIGLGLFFIFCAGAPIIWIYRRWKNSPVVDFG